MTLYRVLPSDRRADPAEPGGALWWPRVLQGSGRHDNADHYGCMYVSETPVSAVAEALAPFRGTGELSPEMLVRGGRRLALAEIELGGGEGALLDLDDPSVLTGEGLRPSRVATGERLSTQEWAREVYERHPQVRGLRWWSTLEASWINVTLFDRAAPVLGAGEVHLLDTETEAVVHAATFLGLAGRRA